jgi:hypothetical protein
MNDLYDNKTQTKQVQVNKAQIKKMIQEQINKQQISQKLGENQPKTQNEKENQNLKSTLNIYTKYFSNSIIANDTKLKATDETIKFFNAYSNQILAGLRYTKELYNNKSSEQNNNINNITDTNNTKNNNKSLIKAVVLNSNKEKIDEKHKEYKAIITSVINNMNKKNTNNKNKQNTNTNNNNSSLISFSYFIGTNYLYEFDGTMNATAYNIKIDSPSLKGSTYSLEMGAKTQIGNININLNVDGYLGKREGAGGKISLGYIW